MCNCATCVNKSLGRIGAIADCVCGDCANDPAPLPIPGSTGTTSPAPATINIYNDFAPLNFDSPIYVYPDGTYSNIPPGTSTQPGTGGGTTIPPEVPSSSGGTTNPPAEVPQTPAPPDETPTTVEKMFPWFLLLALGYAGYQVLKPGKQERGKRRKRA